MRTLINATGLVVVVAALVTFCVLNINQVDLILPVLNGWQIEYTAWPLPLCVLVLAPLGFGIVLGCLLDAVKIFQLKNQVRALKKETEREFYATSPFFFPQGFVTPNSCARIFERCLLSLRFSNRLGPSSNNLFSSSVSGRT